MFKLFSIGIFLTCLSCCFSVTASSESRQSNKDYLLLDRLAVEASTDKSSLFHNYMKVYTKYFSPLRNQKIKFLEIGIYQGASVRLWESYFVNGELHFVDMDPGQVPIQYFSTKSKYHFVDQSNIAEMRNLAIGIGGDLDVVLDDGGHTMDQQINSFIALFPFLKSGGLYVIEDLHTSYWREFGGHGQIGNPIPGPGTCVEFLKSRIDDLNYTAGVTQCADFDRAPADVKAKLTEYQRDIDSMHFYQSLCVIIKK